MSENLANRKVLETLWEAGKPLNPQEISAKTGMAFSFLMSHLQRLVKAGYVSTPKRGFYALTEHGKGQIGVAKADKKRAKSILTPIPLEKSFHFHRGINEYVGVYANSLNDFCRKILEVDLSSIEFHLFRRDFESWIKEGLGDPELANRIGLIRAMDLTGENLRKRLYETVESRCKELESLSHEIL